MSKFLRLSLVALCLALGAVQALAQSQANTGQISGSVTDTNQAAVPNATVTVTNKETGLTRTATTSDDGLYTIVLLPPGSYSVAAQAATFAEARVDNVVVNVGRTADANLTLGVSGVQESVLVTADESVQVTRPESDAVLNQTAISTLPINGRRFQDFVTLTPTAQVDPQRGQISLSGQKGINSNINVDGVDYNQPFFGGIRGGERSNLAFTIPQEAIKEFQVVASGYSAEFGRSSGGLVNAVTKSGSNDIRGTAFYLVRPQSLARSNEFTEALQEQQLSARGVDASLAPTQHQFGGSVGGPIVENKLFFFGAYEQQVFNAPRQIVFNNFAPGLTGANPGQQAVVDFFRAQQESYELTNDAWAGLIRMDWNVNDSNQFNARFNMSENEALNAVSRGETSLDPTTNQALSTNGTEKNENKIFVAQLISTLSPSSINELRFQFAREDRPRESNSEIPQLLTTFGTIGATAFLPTTQFDRRLQFADSVTLLRGNHNIKFGGEFSNIYANQVFGFNQFGQYVYNTSNVSQTLACLSNVRSTTACRSGGITPYLGRFDDNSGTGTARYLKQLGNLQADFTVRELAFFAQDSYRLTPQLTLNYGLRAEQQFNPEAETSNTALTQAVQNTVFPIRGRGYSPTIPDSGWQWGPRFGFAYDPVGDGKTVLRGFGGVYYARTPLLVFADSTNNFRDIPANVSTQLPFPGFSQTAFNTFAASAAGAPYRTITGCNPSAPTTDPARLACTPSTIYRQFAIAGINLNEFPLDGLPILSTEQIAAIAGALGLNPNPFVSAQVTGHSENFKNPRSIQFGFAFEREIARNFVVGVDYAHIKTDFIQRNRDINLPLPLTAQQYVDFLRDNNSAAAFNALIANGTIGTILAANRSYIAINTPAGLGLPNNIVTTRLRPTQAQGQIALGAVQIRESTARSDYDGLTFRMRMNRRRFLVNAYYTLSRSLGDDDNERDAGGVAYADPYDLSGEYNYSRLDRRHQFVANPIVFLPWDFEISSAIRLRSGTPLNSTAGLDFNGDGVNNDRPLIAPGVTYKRNAFRNRSIYDIDLRTQKSFRFDEQRRLIFTAEFFNLFNRSNIIFPTPNTATSSGPLAQFCGITPGATITPTCGLNGPNNANFLRITDSATGQLIVNNINPGSQVFQMQLGARFEF
jgi:hypothetical protein